MSTTFSRTDEESLEITRISKLPRIDSEFSMSATITKYRDQLDKVKPMNDWLLVIEDMRPRTTGMIIPVKNKYTQFKGMIYAAGPKIKSSALLPGEFIMWGLYNGKHIDIAPGLQTWFVREQHVLGLCSDESRLSD